MGAAWSSYRLKRKEKALYKKRLRKQLAKAEEHIMFLQEQHHLVDELLRQQRCYYPDPSPVADIAEVENTTAQMEEEIRALKEKLHLEHIALVVTNERCQKLEKNLSLLQQNEDYLQQETSLGERRLSALRLKLEASQFAQFQKTHPLEKWTVCSLPELRLPEL